MERNTFIISFFAKQTKLTRQGLIPIYARITSNGLRAELYTQCRLEPHKWSQSAERAIGKDKISRQIRTII